MRNALPIIREMLFNGKDIELIEKYIELMLELLPNEHGASDNRSYFIEEFLLDQEIIEKLADICSEAFLIKLANNLTQTLDQRPEVVLKDGLKIQIQEDSSLRVTLTDTSIDFTLQYFEFKDKYAKIKPIIEKELENYNGTKDRFLVNKILYWYTYIWSDLTYISYPSLYAKPKGYYKARQAVLIYLLKEILLIKLTKQGVDKFLNTYQIITSQNKYFIFKRIFLYCYAKEFEQTRNELLALLEHEKYLLFSLYFEAEMYSLLENNVEKFTPIEKKKIEEIIENGPYSERIWDENRADGTTLSRAKKFWQQEWYAPLNNVEPFKHKYEELRQQTHMKEFFNFRDGTEIRPLHYNSLLGDMEILSLLENAPKEYVTKIVEFTKREPNRVIASMHEMAHTEGNVEQMRRLAENYPAIITESITELTELAPIYVRNILYGLRATKDRKNIKWKKVNFFVESYVDRLFQIKQVVPVNESTEDIINDEPEGKVAESIVGAWADAISIQEDRDYFDISEIKRLLLKYLELLLENYSFDSEAMYYLQGGKKYPLDYLTLAINTEVGKVLEKLIRLLLSEDVHNLVTLQNVYDMMIERRVVEAHVFLGFYFIYFYQNLKEWTKNTIDSILNLSRNEETYKYWEMFFEGFIKSNNQYLDYYEWMFAHYARAIETYNGKGNERLINLFVQFFISGKDELNDKSLICLCWEKSAFQLLSGCIRDISFSLNRAKSYGYTPTEEDIEQEKRVLPKAKKLWDFLWRKIDDMHNISLAESPTEQKKLFADMLELIPSLSSLNNQTEGRISQLIDCEDPAFWGTSSLFSNLMYLVEKNDNQKNEILNLAKLYHKIIQRMDYFTISEQHQEIINLLKRYISDSEIKFQIDLIKNVYVDKKWNQYLTWF